VFHEEFGSWHAWRFAIIFEQIELRASDSLCLQSVKPKISFDKSEVEKANALIAGLDYQSDTSHIWL
jgi:hypothetical protein